MDVYVRKGMISDIPTEAAILFHFEGDTSFYGAASVFNKKSGGLLGEILSNGDFTGKLYQCVVVYTRGACPARRIVMAGLGKRVDFTLDRFRGVVAKAAQSLRAVHVKNFASSLDIGGGLPLESLAEAMVEGVILGLYKFDHFKTTEQDAGSEPAEFVIYEEQERAVKIIRSAAKYAEIVSRAVIYARDIVSTPANEMTPTDLANEAKQTAKGKNIECRILGVDEIKELGMNAILAVSSGSQEQPKFIIMEYKGGKKSSPFIALVGKGLTFDSGGLSIKPSEKMDQMKSDMAGGAAVIAAVRAVAELGLPINVVGLVPAVENMPGGRAYRPGDIIKTFSGYTIEVVSTDAEGRLILADALTYAGRYKPAAIIDIATLTGACIIALGDQIIGMFGKDEDLKNEIREAAKITGETVWELPLYEEYEDLIKGDSADYKNSGGRAGGAITAALLLAKFCGDYPWVHLDIAGPAWLTKDRPYIPKGASGAGVRLLVRFMQNWYLSDRPSHPEGERR